MVSAGRVAKFLKTKYPNIQIHYRSEEPGEIIYETNDVDGKSYFPERYILDFLDGSAYFNNLEEVAEYVSKKTGKEVKTEEEIETALDELEAREQEENEEQDIRSFKFLSLERRREAEKQEREHRERKNFKREDRDNGDRKKGGKGNKRNGKFGNDFLDDDED